jgi:heme oxygenase
LISSASTSAGASPLRQQLKCETAAIHRRLEAQLGLLEPQLSIHRYRRVLETFYGFYAPVEVSLVRLAASSSQLTFPLRDRSALIENDLRALGMSPRELAELPRCRKVPRLECSENLAGCLYVLEGACLGGQMIAAVLHRQFGMVGESGASFFVGDGEATSARWRIVLAWLEGRVEAGARCEQIVASARECFVTLSRWVKRQGASR